MADTFTPLAAFTVPPPSMALLSPVKTLTANTGVTAALPAPASATAVLSRFTSFTDFRLKLPLFASISLATTAFTLLFRDW